MLRIGPLLLVASLVALRASVPFAHFHAHGGERGAVPRADPAPVSDSHCDGHHRHGAHWHLPGTTADDRAGRPMFASAHEHAAVALDAGAMKPDPPRLVPVLAVAGAREAAVTTHPGEAPPATAFADGLDPPPRAVVSTRAPPPPR